MLWTQRASLAKLSNSEKYEYASFEMFDEVKGSYNELDEEHYSYPCGAVKINFSASDPLASQQTSLLPIW